MADQQPSNHTVDQQPNSHSADQQPSSHSADQQPSNHSADQQPSSHSADQQPSSNMADQQPRNHMADQQPSTSDASSGGSESSVELNIKTLNSQIYSFIIDKNMPVSAFKEKIASQIGLPVEQQRLIFRGKVLKDDHVLSEYHVENGHTLHLVERQPSQPQPSSGSNNGNAGPNNSGRAGLEPGVGGVRNRVGQISHSVVLGTFNVGEQGEGTMPDLSRVIGAVLNSFGVGSQPGMQPSVQVPPRGGTEGTTNGAGSQSNGGNQSQMGQPFIGQSLPQVMQIPVGGPAIALPSLNMPIPDSLNTICEFVNRMEQAISQHGYQPSQPPPDTDNLQTTQLPSSPLGVPTPEALGIVLRRIQHLMGGPAMAALAHVANRLEQEAGSNDPTVRGQIQTDSVQVGLAMQHLGALLLELGRTMLTLRMEQSPAESSVNAGPAVYVSPSGPNPIMVQPFPLQSTSMFGSSATVPPNPGTFGPVGLGSLPRNVNIHIHTGASLAPFVPGVGTRTNNADGTQGDRVDGSSSGDSGQSRVHPMRGINVAAVPVRPATGSVAGAAEPTSGVQELAVVSGAGNDSRTEPNISSSSRLGVTSQPLSGVSDMITSERYNGEVVGASENSKPSSSAVGGNLETSSSSQGMDNPGGSSSVPLGLGLKGLQPKRRTRLLRSQSKADDAPGTSSQSEQPRIAGQRVLQSLGSIAFREEKPDDQLDVGNAMSQVLQTPALNGLLSGVAQQTGIGSPDALRNIMSQITQNPAMRNTVNQIAQQIDNHDIGDMMASMGGGQGGGFDLSRMIQQMMPIVSQALGGASTGSSPALAVGPDQTDSSRALGVAPSLNQNSQVNIHQVAQRIEQHSPPREIFRSVVENALQMCDGVNDRSNVVNELCRDEGLRNEFIEMLREDLSQRIPKEESNP